jgi:hypothetical protein
MPLLIVQRNVALVPAGTPVIVVVADVGVVTVAVPLTTLHTPVPTVGTLPAIVNVPLLQLIRSAPAAAGVGSAVLVIVSSSVDTGQMPLEIVQRNVALVPAGTPVMVVVADVGVVIVAVPLTTLHTPVPIVGTLPAIVNVPLLQFT